MSHRDAPRLFGGVNYHACFGPDQGDRVVSRTQAEREHTEVVDLRVYAWRPWAPFGDLARASRSLTRDYFRHACLFRDDVSPPPEPLIDEEWAYERGRLADTLVERLVAGGPRTLVLRHAEGLGPEAFYLLERLREFHPGPLHVEVCFEGPLIDGERFDQLDALGCVTWDPTESGDYAVPRGGSHGLEPTSEQRRQLLRWLCFETVAGLTSADAAVDRLEGLAAVGGFEEGIDLGEALVRRLPASEVATLRQVRIDLARLYRQAGDPASAARSLTLGWALARNHDPSDGARIDFLLFETSYRSLVVEDVYLGLEDRLVEALRSLGWKNHLSYVYTKNVWVQTVGRTQGWEEARRMWEQGRRLVSRTANRRRLAVALQTQGSLLAIEGHLAQALVSTRRAVRLARQYSSALHAAKVENGLGFLEFSAGHYRRAWEHHRRALDLLPETRDHQEYVGTLINLGRLYLLNDQADRALPLLTTALRAMDGLGLADLPFHPRSNTQALEAVCCLKLGQPERAQEFLKKLRSLDAATGKTSEHRLCLEVLVAQELNEETAPQRWLEAKRFLTARVADLRHLLFWLLVETGRWQAAHGGEPARLWDEAAALIPPAPLGGDLRRQLEACRSPSVRRSPLPVLRWDSPLLVRFSKQEAALRRLRRTVQDYGFLQTWHEVLLPGVPVDRLFLDAVTLIRAHFPVDAVALLRGGSDEVLALAPGSDASLIQRVARVGADHAASEASLVEVFDLESMGVVQASLYCVDTHPEPLFGPEDRKILELAVDHLSVLLLSQRRAQDLEERGIHLTRALEVLSETQQKLIQSENLAVLGTLSAGLAHELNTPLGAILSSTGTVRSLLTGPLGTLVDSAQDWSLEARHLYRLLAERLLGREASLGPLNRSERRTLRELLEAREGPSPDLQADLWFEVGLGSDQDLHDAHGRDSSIVEALERLVPLSQAHRLTRVIEDAAHRASAVVGTLRSYLQGGDEEGTSWFVLAEELESVLAVLGASRWRSIRLERRVPPDLRVEGRRLPLAQVWSNLIQNAVQAMEGQGTLTIQARLVAQDVVVEVADTGPGIPEHLRERILEPFFSTKRQTGGLGLGLDITRRIVEGHHGRLEFESRPGWTVFRVTLPAGQRTPPPLGLY